MKKIQNTNPKTLAELVNIVRDITTPTKETLQKVIDNIRKEVKTYVETNGLKSLVLGVSGGLDSSVVAALCQEKYTGVPLIGISIPMSSSNAHKEQAKWIGDNYCSVFEEFTGWDESKFNVNVTKEDLDNYSTNMISEICNTTSMTDKLAEKAGFKVETFPKSVLDGNIKARVRAITLRDLARKTNGLVLGTGQRSEDEFTKFFTLGGDDATDYDVIHNICKGFELPIVAQALGIRTDIITQKPSDGLMVTDANTDEAQLGANYQEIDTIMNIYLGYLPITQVEKDRLKYQMFSIIETDLDGAKKVAKIIKRYEQFKFKFNGTIYLTREQVGLN